MPWMYLELITRTGIRKTLMHRLLNRPEKGIEWHFRLNPDPVTLSGEAQPETLSLVVYRDGNYYICRENILKSGITSFDLNKWNTLKLKMKGAQLSTFLNGQLITSSTDNQYSHGLAGFGCGWHEAEFDNLMIEK